MHILINSNQKCVSYLTLLAFRRETADGTKQCLNLVVLTNGSLSNEPDGKN